MRIGFTSAKFNGDKKMASRLKRIPIKLKPHKFMLIVMLILTLTCAGIVWQLYQLNQHRHYNQSLQSTTLSGINKADYILLDAWKLGKQKEYQRAARLYNKVSKANQLALRGVAHYNAANLYHKQAIDLLEQKGLGAWDEVTPLMAMAKEHYRSALRYQPEQLEAKYNLELVLRFSPNIESSTQKIEKEEELEDGPVINGWPSIPGFPKGMP